MEPRYVLRAEGLTVLCVTLGGYLSFGGPLWLLVVVAVLPDGSMAGYLVDDRVGAHVYNAVHTYVGPLVLGGVGLWADVRLATLVALVWGAHLGVDRALGYGLKHASGFGDTHLSPAREAPS